MSADVLSVTAEMSADGSRPLVLVKIAATQVELNVWVGLDERGRLIEVAGTRWDAGSLRIGEVAGASAWWSADPEAGTLSILVGHDDETWDVAVTLPLATLDAVLAEVARCT